VVRHVERSIEVAVPVRTAYDQWTQFEEFPRFMSGVQEVRQVGDALTHWVAEIAGVRREWDAAILEQVPDEKVAWAATSGATNAGAVYFTPVGEACTRVRLTLDYEPEGVVERIGDILDVIDRQAVADLDRFKEFIEQTGAATGTWRGTIEEGDVRDEHSPDERGAHEVEGDVAAVGPTGDVRGTYDDEPGEGGARRGSGPAAGAAGDDETGVAGFGTDTGLSSDDPASFTGEPAGRSDGSSGAGSGASGPTTG
jgi:carbon monoxide dehydrogenase subunit G